MCWYVEVLSDYFNDYKKCFILFYILQYLFNLFFLLILLQWNQHSTKNLRTQMYWLARLFNFIVLSKEIHSRKCCGVRTMGICQLEGNKLNFYIWCIYYVCFCPFFSFWGLVIHETTRKTTPPVPLMYFEGIF